MHKCEYRQDKKCLLASEIADYDIFVNNGICNKCQQNGKPTKDNKIVQGLIPLNLKVNPVDKTDCKHLGDHIGEMDCKCAGKKEVFHCVLHEYCAKRQLNSHPKVIIDGETKDVKLQYCRFCKDYE